jgi:hypothetical protein
VRINSREVQSSLRTWDNIKLERWGILKLMTLFGLVWLIFFMWSPHLLHGQSSPSNVCFVPMFMKLGCHDLYKEKIWHVLQYVHLGRDHHVSSGHSDEILLRLLLYKGRLKGSANTMQKCGKVYRDLHLPNFH